MHQRRARPLELPECRGREGRTCVRECCLPPLRTRLAPSAGWPSPQEAHSWRRPHLRNSPQNSACAKIIGKPPPPTSHAQAYFFQSAFSSVSHFALTTAPCDNEADAALVFQAQQRWSSLITGLGQRQVQRPNWAFRIRTFML